MSPQILNFDWAPYCGQPPLTNELWTRWTMDPLLWLLIAGLGILSTQLSSKHRRHAGQWAALCLFAIFVSPLCAASMSLFAARITQHLALVLIAAPLLASAFIRPPKEMLWPSLGLFTVLFWYWHFPAPYAQSLQTDATYWLMHLSILFGASLFWGCVQAAWRTRNLLKAGFALMGAGAQMTFLAATLMFSSEPWHDWHLWAAPRLALSGMADQHVAAALMWTAGTVLVVFWLVKTIMRLVQQYDDGTKTSADPHLSP